MDLDRGQDFLDFFWPFLIGEGEVPKVILASLYPVDTSSVPIKSEYNLIKYERLKTSH